MRQCLLAMKDVRDNNGGGVVYGFVTTGESWQMLRYDGKDFCLPRKIHSVFGRMDEDKDLWMKDCFVLVDCFNVALGRGLAWPLVLHWGYDAPLSAAPQHHHVRENT